MKSQNSKLKLYFFLTALVIGLIPTWLLRTVMDSDGIPYLDIGDAVFSGNWKALINAIWSPVYAIIIGFFLHVFKPSFEWECTVVHLANFFIYLVSFFCFDFFLKELIKTCRQREINISKEKLITLPEWALSVLGYTLFIWSSINFVTLSITAPDMCVSAFVFLLAGSLLKINSGNANWVTFFFFGIILALGYLSKTAMFLIAFIFLGTAVVAVLKHKRNFINIIIAFLTFCLISSPFILLLSKSKGHFTYGETGNINYHWYANYNVCECFQNGFPNCGNKLIHPVRVIFSNPAVFEYSTPFKVTYPTVYDLSYWCEGVKPYFDLKGQIRAIWINAQIYFKMFSTLQSGLILAFFVMLFMSNRGLSSLKDASKNWILLLPSILVMAMYSLVHVEERYISSFIVLFWLGLFSAVKFPDSKEIKRIISYLILILVVFLLITSVFSKDLLENRLTALDNKVNWTVASHLKNIGIKAGDEVGVIGIYDDYYWARLIKVHIIAEIPADEEINNFWASDSLIKSQVLQAFKNAGAKILVAGRAPSVVSKNGWINIKNTPYYYYVL